MTCSCGCGTCDDQSRVHLRANLSSGSRREMFKAREHLVVPVVMLRQTVVNGAFVPAKELHAAAWNGTPVTVNHPQARGQDISANNPKVLEKWQIGVVFNSTVKGDRLVAEAWIDIDQAEELSPGLVDQLEAGVPMDVSTGYFPTATKQNGVYNGKSYTEIHRELKPDHFALLPNDVGACSWEDGCGVRAANKKGKTMADEETGERGLAASFFKFFSTNRRGEDDDRRQIVADLISNDDTPFVPDDMFSLMDMTQESLEILRDKFLEDSEPETNKEGDAVVSDATKKAGPDSAPATNKVSDMTIEDFQKMVANTASEAAETAVKQHVETNKSADLIAKLVKNEDLGFEEEELKALPLSTLEKLAAHADKKAEKPAPKNQSKGNYGGRVLQTKADDGGGEPKKYGDMSTNVSTLDKFAKTKEA